MSFTETLTTIAVLLGIFLLAYSAIRHQGIGDTFREIKDIFHNTVASKIEDKVAYQ
jgi:hypothetical protein